MKINRPSLRRTRRISWSPRPTSAIVQSVALGSLFVAVAASSDAVYVIAADAASPALSRGGSSRGWGRYFAAAAYFGLAAFTVAFSSRGAARH